MWGEGAERGREVWRKAADGEPKTELCCADTLGAAEEQGEH